MKSKREGFTMVEVVVALVLMAVILTMLAGLTYSTARQAIVADNTMAGQAVALQTINRFATMPYGNIAAAATPACDSVGTANREFETCISLSAGSGTTIIQVTTTPLQHNLPPTTLQIVRSAPPANNPLCVGC